MAKTPIEEAAEEILRTMANLIVATIPLHSAVEEYTCPECKLIQVALKAGADFQHGYNEYREEKKGV